MWIANGATTKKASHRRIMKVGVDYTSAAQRAGIGRYTRSLVGALVDLSPTDLFTLLAPRQPGNAWTTKPNRPKVRHRELPLSERTLTRLWHRLRLPVFADLLVGGADVFYAPDFVLPPLWRAPGVITVHDLSYHLFPDTFPESLRSYLETVVPRSVARAALILVDSAATQRDLVAAYQVDPARVRVLLCGVDPVFQEQDADAARQAAVRRYGIDCPYFLSVGTIQPRKNIARIIAAMRRVVDNGLPHHLVHVGRPGWLHEPILAAPHEHRVSERVHFLTDVDSDADLATLYCGATAFVFPSLYEGFGIPVLEAMACGTPVITGNISSLPEVAGEAAILVDPTDVEAIGEALVVLALDESLREQHIAAGKERAAVFTWKRAAQELQTHLMSVAQCLP